NFYRNASNHALIQQNVSEDVYTKNKSITEAEKSFLEKLPAKYKNKALVNFINYTRVTDQPNSTVPTKIVKPPKPTKPKKISRPPNSFILYRKDKQYQIIVEFPGIKNNDVSKKIGELWANESLEVHNLYQDMARKLKEQHMRNNPDYKYRPHTRLTPNKRIILPSQNNQSITKPELEPKSESKDRQSKENNDIKDKNDIEQEFIENEFDNEFRALESKKGFDDLHQITILAGLYKAYEVKNASILLRDIFLIVN
ncbi:18664_t:CDS:2, partial [Gigaspora margarita]